MPWNKQEQRQRFQSEYHRGRTADVTSSKRRGAIIVAASSAKNNEAEVVIDPDYRVAGLFLIVGLILDQIPVIQWTLGLLTTLLGILFYVQTQRIRFVFTKNNEFELKINKGSSNYSENDSPDPSAQLVEMEENVVVGGANRWACEKIVNYAFFPKSWMDSFPWFPILVYFKETQTPSDTWDQGPGKIANDPEKVASGLAIPGQVHFFPAVCNAAQIKREFQKRNCGKIIVPEP
jgi:hypothetical protein